jgi:cytochrome c oxidase subunit 4
MDLNTASENRPKALHDAPHGVGHVVPFSLLRNVFLGLCAMTVITVVASEFDFGELNLLVAMAIAVVKASLVVLFFMHLLWDRPFNAIVFVGCLIFVGLFISLALLDTGQYQHTVSKQEAPMVKDKAGNVRTPMSAEGHGGGH